MPDTGGHSIADMAVSLSIALSKMRLDLAQTMIVARTVGVTNMGMEVIAAERERDIGNCEAALQLFKDLSEIEPQVRALVARKKRGSWIQQIRGAAAL